MVLNESMELYNFVKNGIKNYKSYFIQSRSLFLSKYKNEKSKKSNFECLYNFCELENVFLV